MGKRLVVAIIGSMVVASCAAFDSGNPVVTDVTPAGEPNIAGGGASDIYQGFYAGKMTLKSNTCTKFKAGAVGAEEKWSVDVVQSGEIINMLFEDGTEVPGTLKGSKMTALAKKSGNSWIYDFSFSEDGIEGVIDIVESVTEGQLDKACANYKVSLPKGTKPDGWGAAPASGGK